jgi:hypothetical protein
MTYLCPICENEMTDDEVQSGAIALVVDVAASDRHDVVIVEAHEQCALDSPDHHVR